MEHDVDCDTSNWCAVNNLLKSRKMTVRFRNQTTSRDHPDNNIFIIGLNTAKCPGDLRRL